MTKEIVATDKAPAAVGAYSQAVKANGFVFVSGQVGIDPATSALVQGVAGQTKQILKNLTAILEEAGSNLEKVVKCTILLDDINDFKEVNEIYANVFIESRPARATFAAAGLPIGALVEIEAIAVCV